MKNIAFTTVLLLLLTSCTETVYLFNANISSIDINGTKKYGPKNSTRVSKLIKDPMLAKPEYQYLGRILDSKKVRTGNGFIDYIFLNGNYGVLDSIYIDFIKEAVLPNLSANVSEGITDKTLKEFKNKFSFAPTTYKDQKNLLFDDDYKAIRKKIERSIYQTISNKIIQTQKIEAIFRGGIEANVQAVLKESDIEYEGDIKAKIESLVKSSVSITGKYTDLEMRQEFRDKLIQLLRHLKKNPPSGDENNAFLNNYLDRFKDDGGLVATGYSLLQFEISYNTSKINKGEVQLIIDGIASLSSESKTELTGKVYTSFNYSKDFDGESKSTKNYLLRYSYHESVQEQRP